MEIESVDCEIRDFYHKNADPAVITKYARYFVEGYNAYGVPLKLIEEEHRELFNKYSKELGFSGFLDLGDHLIRTGKYEDASFALLFATDFVQDYSPAIFERLGRWLDDGVCNWAHADMLAGGIISTFLLQGIVPYTALAPWRTAESKWKRRVVPVSLIKVLYRLPQMEEVLEFLSPMMRMPEKVVHQGLGWFPREAWKHSPQPVEEFLFEWKDTAPRLIFQYATEKMTGEQKARFRKAK